MHWTSGAAKAFADAKPTPPKVRSKFLSVELFQHFWAKYGGETKMLRTHL